MWVPRLCEWKTRLRPSGENWGFAADGPPFNWTGFEPSALAIQISSAPERVEENAIRRPWGEYAGV